MKYSIELGKHSADKDHTVMTGGTLSIDKTIRCDSGVTFYTYSIPMYEGNFDEDFHKGVHTAEHLLAYKEDTGSVRNSVEEVSGGEIEGKVILDISPYKTGENTFGFRITSMIPLPVKQVQAFTKISIERAIAFLENGTAEHVDDFEGIPFARAVSCGQFNFHNKARAIRDLKTSLTRDVTIEEQEIKTNHTTAYVCDLRFLKPKVETDDDLVMFSPDFSYRLSLLIEKELPNKLPGTITIVGTFGCMTGMYLCVSSASGDQSDIALIHNTIIEIIRENIDPNTLEEAERMQLQKLLENFSKYSK